MDQEPPSDPGQDIHTIPEPRDQAARYARGSVVERGFRQVEQWRGLATHYDKHARTYAGALDLAALLTWLP